jgi:GWxTD domain-containing protein
MSRSSTAALLILVVSLCVVGCGIDPLRQSTAGRTLSHVAGRPDFDLEVVEDADTSATWIDVAMRLPHSSLIYTREGAHYRALYEVRTRITLASEDIPSIDELSMDSLLSSDDHGDPGERLLDTRYDLAPGEYLVEVTVEDLNTNRTAVRRQRAVVFSISDGCARFSRVRVFRTGGGKRTPYLAFQIPQFTDTLEAIAKVYNLPAIQESTVTARLFRYPNDTSYATPPFYLSPTSWALTYRGIDYDKPETLRVMEFRLSEGVACTLRVDGLFLRRGLYELVLECKGLPCANESMPYDLRQKGYLSVMESGFPTPVTLTQLTECLPYIALPPEMTELRDSVAPGERRRRFEKFWLKLGGSPEAARSLIKGYYSRVEDANLRFSSSKEGWKTDRGMIYIVFGPPGGIEREYQREIWSYEAGYRFIFQLAKTFRPDEPFENYILYRDPAYERIWDKGVDQWRRGQVY